MVERFDVKGWNNEQIEVATDDGSWVRYSDHVAEVEQLRKECAEYRDIAARKSNQVAGMIRAEASAAVKVPDALHIAELIYAAHGFDPAGKAEDGRRTPYGKWAKAVNAAFAILSALTTEPAASHSDDLAVDRFAAAMKAKLAKKREEGRGGWDDPAKCSGEFLSRLLRDHVEKGGPLDVGNLAMMLHQRKEHIAPAAPQEAEPVAWRDWSNLPEIGSKFVALYDDGSGAAFYFRHDDGYIDAEGNETKILNDIERWAYLPAGFEFWCEGVSEPITLPEWKGPATPPAQAVTEAMVEALKAARSVIYDTQQACLFDADDGQIGVSEDAVISSYHFQKICSALKAVDAALKAAQEAKP